MKNKKTINRVLKLIRPYTYLVVSILVLAAVTVAATLYSAGSGDCNLCGISVGDESSDQ